MTVVRLVRRSNQDAVELARALLALVESGELSDINLTMRLDGVEHTVRTGLYRTSPPHAVRAAMRQTIALCEHPD